LMRTDFRADLRVTSLTPHTRHPLHPALIE
jgi:hypothetical protein